jgi:hypothetical protein
VYDAQQVEIVNSFYVGQEQQSLRAKLEFEHDFDAFDDSFAYALGTSLCATFCATLYSNKSICAAFYSLLPAADAEFLR